MSEVLVEKIGTIFLKQLLTLVSGNSGGFQLSQAVGQGGEDTLPTSMSLHTLG
jgi:hypothetical protein